MSKPILQWFPIATAPIDGTIYLATDWKQFRNQNQPPSCFPGQWYLEGGDWIGVFHLDEFKPTHWAPLPVKPKHLKE